jgi:hypothetical protein
MHLPATPIDTAQAWLGPEQQHRRDWVHVLSRQEDAELRGAARALMASGKTLQQIVAADHALPLLAPLIQRWLRELDDGRGFVLVKGLSVDALSADEAALAYWIIGLHMGKPVAQNRAGDLLGHVRDTGDDPDKIGTRLYRTRAKQDFHTDGADIIGLLCLKRSRQGGLSRIVSSVSVFNEVARRSPDLLPLLFDNFHWDFEADAAPGMPRTIAHPICKFEHGRLRTFYIGWYIRNAQRFPEVPRLSQAQTDLLDLIEAIANDPAVCLDMDFEPGDMQFLKNAAILHARTAYEDWEDPEKKRHLLRLWLSAEGFKDGDAQLRKGIDTQGSAP